jgi:PST family polysaccharide transporter
MSKYWGYVGTAWNVVIIESIVTIVMYLALKRRGINIIDLGSFKPKNIIKFLKNNLLKEI